MLPARVLTRVPRATVRRSSICGAGATVRSSFCGAGATLHHRRPRGAARHLSTAELHLSTAEQDDRAANDSHLKGTMYNWRVRAVDDALAKAGKAVGDLDVSDLYALGHLDQYHYLGVEACDVAAELLGLGPGSTLLDVGSGIGGPARYLAAKTGCSVLGIELQADLCAAAQRLTERVPGLSSRVRFVAADASEAGSLSLASPFAHDGKFDHFLSLLVNLHVPDRRTLHEGLYDRLRPGGTFVIEECALL